LLYTPSKLFYGHARPPGVPTIIQDQIANMTLIEDLFDLQIPQTIKLSPNGQQVFYTTTLSYQHRTGEHNLSTLWLAETGKAKSARQITSGLYNDREPRWLPDGQSIAFLSDRGKQGESCAIYILPLSGGGEAYPVTPAENERSIGRYEISPDGKFIAYLSADEKTEEKKAKEKAKDDAQVWGEDWAFNRLRLVHVATKTVSVLVSKDAHITDFAWNDDGSKVAYCEARTPWIESPFQHGTDISIVDVKSKEVESVCHFPNPIAGWIVLGGGFIWAGQMLYFIGPVGEDKAISANTVYRIDLQAKGERAYEKHAHGDEDCAVGLKKAGSDVLVGVQQGMADQIRILNGHTLFTKKRKTLAWDAAFTKDSDEVVIALAQGDTNHPPEVSTTTASGGAMIQLSDHGHNITSTDRKFGTCSFLTCPSSDSKVALECPFFTPASASTTTDGKPTSPLPTAVLIHGGPYYRHTESFDALYFYWAPILLSAGYAILLTDYRGSSGRGDTFAAYARGTGKYDYGDVITLTNHAVKQGLADQNRLIVGGWSQGGFLSYLCSVRNGTHGFGWSFKAAIPGAGCSELDTMCLTSDLGRTQAQLAGGRPWALEK